MTKKSAKTLKEKDFKSFKTYNAWQKVGFGRRFGFLLPLSYLRTHRSVGIGDFADIGIAAKFAKKIGASIIQLLPINDMGTGKTPYSSMSAFALDPVYIAIDEIPEARENPSNSVLSYIESNREFVERVKNANLVDIDGVRVFKFGLLYRTFRDFVDQNRPWNTPRWRAFQSFIRNNEYWLEDYALFRTLKNIFRWTPWEEWQKEFRQRDPNALHKFKWDNYDELLFVKYVQWIAYQQMVWAHNVCRKEGILLKGDIPILVDYESADVWAHREYFHRDLCAGAPPDQYSKMGQNWGSPPYRWDNLAKDNYIWWKKRLEYASHFFDMYRIDHIVGLFRIWTIPITEEFPRGTPSGWNGFFIPEDIGTSPAKPVWENMGKTLLEMMIDSSVMLPIGEDLGTIPYVCRNTMKKLGICGYKVLIWERKWEEKEAPFIDPKDYDYISMATSTTHDFWTLCGYWEYKDENPEREKEHQKSLKALWKFVMGDKNFSPTYTEELHENILKLLFNSNSIFLIMPFGDLWGKVENTFGEDPEQDRINDPSNPKREKNWRIRLPLCLEDFENHPKLKEKMNLIYKMAKSSNRIPAS